MRFLWATDKFAAHKKQFGVQINLSSTKTNLECGGMTPPVLKYFAIKIKNAPTYQCTLKGCTAPGTIQAR
jgi:hypothetical protein